MAELPFDDAQIKEPVLRFHAVMAKNAAVTVSTNLRVGRLEPMTADIVRRPDLALRDTCHR